MPGIKSTFICYFRPVYATLRPFVTNGPEFLYNSNFPLRIMAMRQLDQSRPPNRQSVRRQHDPSAYDEHLVLKIPLLLWAAMLYTLHSPVAVLLLRLGNKTGNLDYLQQTIDLPGLLAALPGLIVLIAAFRRVPAAGTVWRRVWRHGAGLLLTALGCDIALSAYFVFDQQGMLAWSPILAVKLALTLFFATLLCSSRRIRDTFLEFPPPVPPTP